MNIRNNICAKCMHFYCCNMKQVTSQCPILQNNPVPKEQVETKDKHVKPFKKGDNDETFGKLS